MMRFCFWCCLFFVLIAVRCGALFHVLLSSLSYYCVKRTCLALKYPVWEKLADYIAFIWVVACVLSVLICLVFFLMSLVGCVL